ncbi:MAG: hypothetical protein R3A45_12975 [Bdellovibrionota bacterium]|nr:hypothetical protein [Deltaproteobacteria bacterium]
MKNLGLKYTGLLVLAFLMACGTEPRNTVILQIAGSDIEYSLRNTICEADYAFSGSNSPVRCYGRFRTTSSISDGVTFEIFDAFYIDQNLGKNIALHPSSVWPRVTLDGIERGIVDGYANFSQISNYSGGRVCFQFYMILIDATIQGNFCDNISVGAQF